MRIIRLTLTVILFFLALLLGLAVELEICAQSTLLNPNFYAAQMEKHKIYAIPQDYILIKAKTEYPPTQFEPVCKSLKSATEKAFSTEWTQNQTSYLIFNFINYLKNDHADLNLKLDLKDRNEMLEEEMSQCLNVYTPEELSKFGIETDDTKIIAASLMDKLDLPQSLDFSQSLRFKDATMTKAFAIFKTYYTYIALLPFFVIIIVLILLLIIAGKAQGLKLFGNAILLAGVLVLLVISGTNNMIDDFIIKNIAHQDKLVATMGTNPFLLATILKNSIIAVLYKIAIFSGLLGLILTIIGAYRAKKIPPTYNSSCDRHL